MHAAGLGGSATHPADRTANKLDAAQRTGDFLQCQRVLAEAVSAFETNHEALNRALFDVFGSVVQCASLQCYSLVQLYLQLVVDHCPGREVMTLIMATLDGMSGYAEMWFTYHQKDLVSSPQCDTLCRSGWPAESQLLAMTAAEVLTKLQRQQTRTLADYLQVLLNASKSAGLSVALLKSINGTFEGLRSALPPVSMEQHPHDNVQLLCCFALQIVLQHTLTQPLPQTQEFHRSPDHARPNQSQHVHRHNPSAMHQQLTMSMLARLHHFGCGTTTQIASLLHSLQHPDGTSKVPSVDDAAFTEISELQVCLSLLLVHGNLCDAPQHV